MASYHPQFQPPRDQHEPFDPPCPTEALRQTSEGWSTHAALTNPCANVKPKIFGAVIAADGTLLPSIHISGIIHTQTRRLATKFATADRKIRVSKAFEKSTLITHMGMPIANDLSKTRCAVSKCSSKRRLCREHAILLTCVVFLVFS